MNNTKILLIILTSIALGLLLIKKSALAPTVSDQDQKNITLLSPSPMPSKTPLQFSKPALVIDELKTYQVTLKTDLGDIIIELDTQKTPITANNFIFLAQQKFYNQTVFHRVINGFMIQGGDPQGDGTGGPGYKFKDETFSGEYDRGTVAMANSGPDTNGSQFFIMHQNNPLPKNYTIFGRVIQGLDVLDAIATAPVIPGPTGEKSQPVKPIAIQETIITSN